MVGPTFVPTPTRIKAVGLGGGGCNAVSRMVGVGIEGVEFVGINCDALALARCEAPTRIQIGEKLTGGLGGGGNPDIGLKAAEESRDQLREIVSDAEMIFITAGLGGGTGTGAAPLIAELAREAGALTIAVVTTPFAFEGMQRRRIAEGGIDNLINKVDTAVVIPNDRLLSYVDPKFRLADAFKMVDEVIERGVRAIVEVITVPGLINLDFADLRTVMKEGGAALMAIGRGRGSTRAIDAAREAIVSEMLGISIEGAKRVLVNVTGGDSLSIHEIREAVDLIDKAVDPNANVLFGVIIDPAMGEETRVTVVATGFILKTLTPTPKAGELLPLSRRLEPMRRFEPIRRLEPMTYKEEVELDVPSYMRRSFPGAKPPERKKS